MLVAVFAAGMFVLARLFWGRLGRGLGAIEEVFPFLACVPLLSRMLGSCHLVDVVASHGLSLHFLSGLSVSHLFIDFQLPKCSSPSEPVSIGVLASWPCFFGAGVVGSRARGFVSAFGVGVSSRPCTFVVFLGWFMSSTLFPTWLFLHSVT